jgi:hypothetical protein
MSAALELSSNFAQVQRSLLRLREIEALPAEITERRRPEISGWCALEHLAHVALANELIVRNLESLAANQGLLLLAEGEPVDEALQVLLSGVIPRGRVQSPRMVRPPVNIDRALLSDWLATAEIGFAKFAAEPAALAAAPGRVPHQLLGPLSGILWVRFANVHTRHHLAIVEEVLG